MRIPIAAAIAVTVILSGCIPPPGPAGVVYDRPLPPRGVAPGPGYVWVNNRWPLKTIMAPMSALTILVYVCLPLMAV